MTPPSGDGGESSQPLAASARRRRRWKRTALLVPVLVLMFLAAVAERGDPATGKTGTAAILAALEDPLSLFAGRSPGARGPGPLLSTKPERTAFAGPEERVLSEVRDRDPGDPGLSDPPGDPPPAGDTPLDSFPQGFSTGRGLPGGGGGPGGFAGAPFVPPYFATTELDNPVHPPGGGGGGIGGPPLVSGIPEPATWAMLILGFFFIGTAMRRRARQPADPASQR